MPAATTCCPTNDAAAAPGRPNGELRLRVRGMECAGCAANVQRAVEAEEGVASASVSYTEGVATIAGEHLDADRFIKVIQGRGFDAEPIVERASVSERRTEIEQRQTQRERQWRFRAITGIGIWIPMAILHWGGFHHAWIPWALGALATLAIVLVGSGFYRSAWRAAMHRTTNMDTLISMGATAAYAFSMVVLLSPLFGEAIDEPLYFGEAAALLGIISLGHWFEARAAAKAGSAVRELLELQPETARRLDDHGGFETVDTAEIRPGDRVVILPGDRIPVDGAVVEGRSDVDESVVTGEPLPATRRPGDEVVAGALNVSGRLVIESAVDGTSTTVARIADLVERAQTSKAAIQRLADRVSAVFVPIVLAIAAVTIIGWSIAGAFGTGLVAAVTVLIISCPCALGLATPMAVMVGAGSASRRGILVKSAASLEAAGGVTTVVFDKTGTLTTGEAVVASVEVEHDAFTENEVLALAASVEMASEHPIGRAIVRAANAEDLDVRPVDGFRSIAGQGVAGTVGERAVEVRRDERATCRVVIDGEVAARITVSDAARVDARAAIERLRQLDVGVRMLSGDRREAAETIGQALGLQPWEIESEATPESKQEYVRSLEGHVAMVGDGINDAAALAASRLGIAMGSGTNIAIESAEVIVPGERVGAIPETIEIARRTLRTIKQNLFFAFAYNVVAIPAAAFGLLGAQGPLIAAIAMACSDLTVVGNAVRLKGILKRLGRDG